MANKVGKLIKEARTAADMTQEQLARKVKNVSANDISKAERGELKLTQDALKQIAKATGVTQKSLLDAAASSTYKSSTAKSTSAKSSSKSSSAKSTSKSSTSKTSSSKSSSSKTSSSKTSSTKSAKSTTPSNANKSMKVTTTEKKLVELYREADSDTKKKAMAVLKGDNSEILESILNGVADSGILESLLNGGKKKETSGVEALIEGLSGLIK